MWSFWSFHTACRCYTKHQSFRCNWDQMYQKFDTAALQSKTRLLVKLQRPWWSGPVLTGAAILAASVAVALALELVFTKRSINELRNGGLQQLLRIGGIYYYTPSLFLIDGAVLITLICKARSEAAVNHFLGQSTTLNSYGAGCCLCSLIEALLLISLLACVARCQALDSGDKLNPN